jgi:inhibitor of KinA
VNAQAIALHQTLIKNPFAGYVESVPGYSSLGVFFDTNRTGLSLQQSVEWVTTELTKRLASLPSQTMAVGKLIEIPVIYGGEYGPDIEFVAKQNNISIEEVIALHSEKIYTVFMIGFLPGFPYLGITDKKITVERKATPRIMVPAGSVALAGNQTGIYPENSPGGWQIIGRTNISLFDAEKNSPNLLQAGDRVKFVETGELPR